VGEGEGGEGGGGGRACQGQPPLLLLIVVVEGCACIAEYGVHNINLFAGSLSAFNYGELFEHDAAASEIPLTYTLYILRFYDPHGV